MTEHRKSAAVIADSDGYTIVENASLQKRNTFGVAANAALLIDVLNPAMLPELFNSDMLKAHPLLVLGEGSNVLFTRDWPGVVLSIAARGVAVIRESDAGVLVRVEAGEKWDDFVHWSIEHACCGLENLALIPGTVGAAPIQNIGAYGVEAGEFIAAVEAWDHRERRMLRLDNAACGFAYRASAFKRDGDRYLITAVEFFLPRERPFRLDYAGVREELSAVGVTEPTSAHVAAAVSRIRKRKLPDPTLVGNAGSFFKNPVVDAQQAQILVKAHRALPNWPADTGRIKLSAAWMVEACGLKGFRQGDAGVSAQHALVMVNHGHASGAQLQALAETVRQRVRARFGVFLESEPRIV